MGWSEHAAALAKLAGRCAGVSLLGVLAAVRPATRIGVPRSALPELLRFAGNANLPLAVGFDGIDCIATPGRGSYSEWCRRTVASPRPEGRVYAYLSRSRAAADELRRLDERGDDRAVGELLGYPQCCIRSFCDYQSDEPLHDPVLPRYCDDKPIAWPMNVSLLCFDIALLHHVPCSESCSASLEFGRDMLAAVEAHLPTTAVELESHLKGIVVHSAKLGIAAITALPVEQGLQVAELRMSHEDSGLAEILHRGVVIGRRDDIYSIQGREFRRNHLKVFSFT